MRRRTLGGIGLRHEGARDGYFFDEVAARIAVLTGNRRLFAHVSACFERDGTLCEPFGDEVSMVRALTSGAFDLILIDVDSAPALGGPVLRWVECHATYPLPVLALGSLGDRYGLLEAIDAGITDLVMGPIDKEELYVRAHLALKRSRSAAPGRCPPAVLSAGPYRLDRHRHLLSLNDTPIITLTAREFALAWLFFSNPNVMFNRQQIACSIWGNEADIVDRTIEQHIYKLRKKLRLDEAEGVRLRTCYSLGYKLEVSAPQDRAEEDGGPLRSARWRPAAQAELWRRQAP